MPNLQHQNLRREKTPNLQQNLRVEKITPNLQHQNFREKS